MMKKARQNQPVQIIDNKKSKKTVRFHDEDDDS